VELIEIMASNGFSNFNAQDSEGWAALHRAAAFGTAEDLRALCRMGASLEIRTNNLAWTPVFTAVCYNNLETLQEIIKIEPPDKDKTDLRGWTLLHVAIGAGSFDVIPELLRLGCDPAALSNATSHSVPEIFIDTAVTPGDIAKACGKEVYTKWAQLLVNAGHSSGEEPDSVDWDTESANNLQFGGCECCEQWNKALR
jgi:ankyrin repeat protein